MLDNLEFRCSYLQSNMSLDDFTKKMQVVHQKLSGQVYDYDKIRYPWTELTEQEIKYITNDVVGLCESIEKELEMHNDTLASIPLTSTGYVRRDIKAAMYVCKKRISKILPTYHIYEMEREAFMGGDTHANRFYVGQKVSNVQCIDISSSYPYQVCCKKYPISKFKNVGECSEEYANDMIYKKEKAALLRVRITNVELSDKYWGCPYLHKDKCRHIKKGVYDNGRILEADSLEVTLTDIDYKIIRREYNCEWEILEMAVANYGYLPQQCIDVVLKYYTDKTQLKDVPGQETYYTKSKNLLNAIYGMFAQNPVKQDILYIAGEFKEAEENESAILDEFNGKTVLAYQWGVWTTARAREQLHDMIFYIGTDNFVYCDTDSVYYVGDIDITDINNKIIKIAEDKKAYATDTYGEIRYMGVWEYDKKCDEFKTWGAKRYVYTKGGDLYVTIAGVSKKKNEKSGKYIASEELARKGGIDVFCDGFIFDEAGGLEIVYNDITPHEIIREGRKLIITKNAVIRPSTYQVIIKPDYMDIIDNAREAVEQLEREI